MRRDATDTGTHPRHSFLDFLILYKEIQTLLKFLEKIDDMFIWLHGDSKLCDWVNVSVKGVCLSVLGLWQTDQGVSISYFNLNATNKKS